MNQRIGFAALLVGALVGTLWFLLAGGRSDQGAIAPAVGAAAVLPQDQHALGSEVDPSAPERTETLRAAASAGSGELDDSVELEASAGERASRLIEGRALDIGGAPLAEVEIHAEGRRSGRLARSARDGSFSFETDAGQDFGIGLHTGIGRLTLHGQRTGFVTVRVAVVTSELPERQALVVLAPAVELGGRVLDVEGRGIEGAQLEVEDDWRGLVDFPLPLHGTESRKHETRSAADGTFHMPQAPRMSGRHLVVRREGFESARLAVPELDSTDLEIRLERTPRSEASEPAIFGFVRFPDGSPAEGARVQLAQSVATSDRDGRFELARLPRLEDEVLLVAMLAGWQPAIWGAIGSLPADGPQRVGPLDLTLPGPALVIAGRLELADGSAASGWSVSLSDPTILDENYVPPAIAERGGEVSRDPARTDREGRFELGGLADREYNLRLWHPRTYVALESGPVRAGATELVLRVPADAVIERISGRVTARGGVPIAGARVEPQFITQRTKRGFTSQSLRGTLTDEQGEFVLEKVPRRHVQLSVGGDELVWTTHVPESHAFDERPLEIEVQRLVRVRLDFSAADPRPDAFRLLDPSGRVLSIESRSAQSSYSSTQVALEEGRSAVLAVSEAAATLVLLRGKEELSRQPVVPLLGEVNELGL